MYFIFLKSKEELFNAVIDRAVSRIYETFTQAEAPADRLMETMGKAFVPIMHAHRDEIIMVMQAHAISAPVIREHVKGKFRIIHGAIIAKFERAGIPYAEEAVSQFVAMGLLITVSEVLDLPQMCHFTNTSK